MAAAAEYPYALVACLPRLRLTPDESTARSRRLPASSAHSPHLTTSSSNLSTKLLAVIVRLLLLVAVVILPCPLLPLPVAVVVISSVLPSQPVLRR